MTQSIKTSLTEAVQNEIASRTPRPALSIDWARYEKMLEGSDLSEVQKREFLQALWNIIVAFVDLGFGIHPLQQVCEQNGKSPLIDVADVLSSEPFAIDNLETKSLAPSKPAE